MEGLVKQARNLESDVESLMDKLNHISSTIAPDVIE